MFTGVNSFAYLSLFSWPVVSIFIFLFARLPVALVVSILGADLLLPAGLSVKLEMIPAIDKNSVACFSAAVGCCVAARRIPRLFTSYSPINLLILGYFLSPFATSLLNGDPIHTGDRVLPGVGIYDAGSAFISQLIFFSPFLLGRQYLRTDSDTFDLFRLLILSGMFYSLLLLFEVRMSPQLHRWVYGYYPSQFAQAIREGGFRPMGFMGHGLLASFFVMTCLIATTALSRVNIRLLNLPTGGIAAYFGVVLLLCKSLGSLLYGLVVTPIVRWTDPKTQIRVAIALAIIGLTYPVARTFELFPDKMLVEYARSVSTERANSLEFRFENENQLLAKASERFWFGWGRYGRNRVYSEYGDQSVTDGRWIITFGQFGAFGFICEFGLLTLPIFFSLRGLRGVENLSAARLLGALALIDGLRVIDQLPNTSISPWAWLLAGALLGRSERCHQNRRLKKRDSETVLRTISVAAS
jgi:hypothetical protein